VCVRETRALIEQRERGFPDRLAVGLVVHAKPSLLFHGFDLIFQVLGIDRKRAQAFGFEPEREVHAI